jgi:hypothetical protein
MRLDRFLRNVFACLAAAACWLVLPAVAVAQGAGADRERAGVVIGAFITNRDTTARLDANGSGPGSDVDLEGDLGLEKSSNVARLGGYVWFNPRHRFDLGYFDLSRSASRRIDKTIEWGDQIFDIDTVVTTKAEVTIVKADYTFVPINRDRGYLGVTGGLYVAETKHSLSEPTLGVAESRSLTAPLPVIGVRGDYAITDRITLRGVAQWFNLETGNVGGHLRDFYVGGDYTFANRFAVGLAYNDVTMRITADKPNGYNGELSWGYDGVLLYFKTNFGK